MSSIEAIFREAMTSLRGGPPVPGPFFVFDIATSSLLHREGKYVFFREVVFFFQRAKY